MEQTTAASEPVLSEEDEKWVKTVQPEVLQTVARRHGRVLFALVWQSGMISEALGAIQTSAQQVGKWGQARHVKSFMQATHVLSQVCDQMCKTALSGHGKNLGQFLECKQDIERAMSLAKGGKPAGENVSPSGIILNS